MATQPDPWAEFRVPAAPVAGAASGAVPELVVGRQPAPQTQPQAQGDVLGNIRTRQQIDEANRTAANAPQDRENARIQRIGELRREFNSRPDIREFMQLRNAVRQIEQLGQSDSAQNDMALIFSFMRTLDPTSVVREGEFANAQNTAGVPEIVRNYYNRALSGERLSPNQRQGMLNTARDLYISGARGYNETAEQYHGLLRELGEDRPGSQIRVASGAINEERRRREAASPPPNPEGDIGFSGRTIGNDTVPLTPAQMQAYDQWMGQQRQGELTPEAHSAAWERITGRPSTNSAEVTRFFNETGRYSPGAGTIYRNPTAGQIAAQRNELMGTPGTEELLFHGATMGLSDEAAGLGEVLSNAVSSPFTDEIFDPFASYTAGRDAESLRLEQARRRTGLLGTVAEIGGSFGAGTIGRVMNLPPTWAGRAAEAARAGAQTGALAGAGYSESPRGEIDPLGTLADTAIGAGIGATVGAAIPTIGAAASQVRQGIRTVTGHDPNVARRVIADAIEADANTPVIAGGQMAEAQGNDVPMMLADTGDNVRGLLAASARAPGPARTLARDALEQRQGELSDRVVSAIERDLGPVTNPHEVQEHLMRRASEEAGPLYDAAYARPGADAFVSQVRALLGRPSMRRAMANARRIAEEEGRNPDELGLVFDRNGDVVLSDVVELGEDAAGNLTIGRTPETTNSPSWQTLDYVKRGMDDVVESYRDTTSGRLRLDTEGRAINDTLRNFLRRIDTANPDYAAARAAYGGPASAVDAMNVGQGALNMTADDLTARTRDFTPNQLEMFRLGYRRAMAEQVASRGDNADVVRALVGTGKKRATLARLFGGRDEFNRFVATLRAEQEGFRTFQRAMLGSPTAANIQDDVALNAAAPLILDMATTGTPITTALREAYRFGVSRAGSNARQDIATLLSESDPTRLREFADELRDQTVAGIFARQRAARRSPGYGIAGGQGAGALIDAYRNR